jgi:glycine oxidase
LNPDFIIIGGGIIGLATAFRLANEGARVTVVERNRISTESSWAGGGILSPLMPWQYSAAVTDLCDRGAALYPEWIASIQAASGLDAEYWDCGMLVLPPFDTGTALDWCRQHQWRTQTVVASHYLPDQPDNEALWLPDVAQVRNPRLIKALRGAALAHGVELLENTSVTALAANQQHIEHVDTAHGKLQAGNYIVCAGAWSQGLLSDYPPSKTIKPIRGQMLLFKADPGLLNRVIYRQGTYLIPRRDGHILVGSTIEDVGFDKSTLPETGKMLMNIAFEILPALRSAALVQHWSGLRPGSPDNVPTIARHPDIDNLYINAGHFRYGVTMAPISAKLICEITLGQAPDLDMSPYQWNSEI